MNKMEREVPSFETPPGTDIGQLVDALMGDGPIAPALVALFLDPERLAAREAANRALRELDWANLGRYERSNAVIVASGQRPDLVFMGDSISELWPLADPSLLTSGRLCRGISGQTSPQMLVRFQADVINLRPRVVHLLAGANDIGGNTGPTTPLRFQHNMLAMISLAQANDIDVVLGLMTPATAMPWSGELDRSPWIAELNGWLRQAAAEQDCHLVDYFAALADGEDRLPADCSHDGLHPNRRGYVRMRAVLEPVLERLGV
ncbi:MAG: family lipase [Massilia sp.]|jgi:hypothetical protein|nr:family lipase [Massilia sp.]